MLIIHLIQLGNLSDVLPLFLCLAFAKAAVALGAVGLAWFLIRRRGPRLRDRLRRLLWMAIEALDDGTLTASNSRNNKTIRGVAFKTGSAGYDSVFGQTVEDDSDTDHSAEVDAIFLKPTSNDDSCWVEEPIGLSGFQGLLDQCSTSSGLSHASTLPLDLSPSRPDWDDHAALDQTAREPKPLEVGFPSIKSALSEFDLSHANVATGDLSDPCR